MRGDGGIGSYNALVGNYLWGDPVWSPVKIKNHTKIDA